MSCSPPSRLVASQAPMLLAGWPAGKDGSRTGVCQRLAYMSTQRPPPPWQLQFVLLSAIWGSSFLFIKVLGERWAPLSRDPRLWLHCAVVAVFFNAAPFTLFAYGEQHTSSIVAGLWNATTPLW